MKLYFRFPSSHGCFRKPLLLNFRHWLFYRAWIASGTYREGGIVPRWLYPLWFLAEPMRFIQMWLGCSHRVWSKDEYLIEGLRINRIFFSALKGTSPTGMKILVARGDDGSLLWEEVR